MSDHIHDQLRDSIMILLLCEEHGNLAVERMKVDSISDPEPKRYRYPIVRPLDKTEPLIEYVYRILGNLLNLSSGQIDSETPSLAGPTLVHMLRAEIPHLNTYVTRYTFWVPLSKAIPSDDCYCEKYMGTAEQPLRWINWHNLETVPNWLTPEAVMYCNLLAEQHQGMVGPFITEFCEVDSHPYSKMVFDDTKKSEKNLELKIMRHIGMGTLEIRRLFSLFIEYTFPFSCYFTPAAMYRFISDFWNQDEPDLDITKLYRSFGHKKHPFIDFEEFLLGICLIDENTPHSTVFGSVRLSYIFRYYATDSKSGLKLSEFHDLVRDIIKVRGAEEKLDPYQEYVEKVFSSKKDIKAFNEGQKVIKYVDFFKAITSHKADGDGGRLRGTSVIFRSPRSFVTLVRGGKPPYIKLSEYPRIGPPSSANDRANRGLCLSHRKVRSKVISDIVLEIDKFRNTKYGEKVDDLQDVSDEVDRLIRDHEVQICRSNEGPLHKIFGVITSRLYHLRKNARTSIFTKGEPLPITLEEITEVCKMAGEIFEEEERLVKVQGPSFVFGDLHESCRDAFNYFENIWPTFPFITPFTLVFMGDYVDRGEQGIELALYLFCLKIMAPHRVILLRGNHETREMNGRFTFFKLCQMRFGDQGDEIWETFNETFDKMPIAALVDENIYCAHGGIPVSVMKIEEILRVPCPMKTPDKESQVAHEILWNDPIDHKEFKEIAGRTNMWKSRTQVDNEPGNDIYTQNDRRGTAYFFNAKAAEQFLATNGLAVIFRAHEACYGLRLECTDENGKLGRVVTVFSSSLYCGESNNSGCVWVDHGRLRGCFFEIPQPGPTDMVPEDRPQELEKKVVFELPI